MYTDYSDEDGKLIEVVDLPTWVFVMVATCVQLFSWADMIDGQRARRLKCGTSLGRVVDEAGDLVQYTWYSMIMGFVLKVKPGWSAICLIITNFPAFTMEMKFIMTNQLKNCATDDLGPVEVELIVALIFLAAAAFGIENMDQPIISSSFGSLLEGVLPSSL